MGCVRQKSKDWKPISSIPSDPGKYFFANILAPILSDVKAKVKKSYYFSLLFHIEQKVLQGVLAIRGFVFRGIAIRGFLKP